MIKPGSVISIKVGIPTVDLDGELALMNPEKGKYYGMDAIATRIWMMIRNPTRFKSMIETLTHEYDVSRQQCEADVKEFLNRLYEEGLFEIEYGVLG